MINNKKIIVVMPAYNAAKTLIDTYNDIPLDIVDEVICVDDCSSDETSELAKQIGIQHVIKLDRNSGYGANQKVCYNKAISLNADIIIMIHADYQYDPRLITAMCSMIAYEVYPVVLGSRILGKGALKGGMPLYKYLANRVLTLIQNIMQGYKLSEYHTGLRAFASYVLKELNYSANSDDFIFDNELLAQLMMRKHVIGEVSCPTRYFKDASSINLKRSIIYGLGVLRVCIMFRLQKLKLINSTLFK